MYIHVYIYIYLYIHAYIYTYTYTYMNVYTYLHMCTRNYALAAASASCVPKLVLRDHIEELYRRIISQNYITGSYDGIVLRTHITRLHYGNKLGAI